MNALLTPIDTAFYEHLNICKGTWLWWEICVLVYCSQGVTVAERN